MKKLSDETLDHLQTIIDTPDLSHTKYELIRKIASGGMGTVYQVRDAELDRQVALKVLNAIEITEQMVQRMMREACILARLEHPGIVPVHDAGILPDGRAFYVMKLIHGKRLDEYCSKTISLPELLRLFQKICDAVAFAHSQEIIHRDLKPANIMVSEFGEVLVMDWGLAKFLSASDLSPVPSKTLNVSDTQAGAVIGTRDFMAPEQATGNPADKSSDVYALGAILKFLLTGLKPPKLLNAICLKATAQNRADRYTGAAELAADVDRFVNGFSVSSYKENTFEKVGRWVDRNKFVVSLILVYMIVRFVIYLLMKR
jgi:serine/threonine protein kinase